MGKCEFFEVCRIADDTSPTCTETNGDYYGPGRMAGCGRDLSEFGNKSTYHKEFIEPTTIKKKIKSKKKIKIKKKITNKKKK